MGSDGSIRGIRGIREIREISEDLVLVEVAGRKVLAAARCPHRQGKLKFARVDGGRLTITCPLHYSTFDLATGARTAGPACDPLRIVDTLPESLSDWPADLLDSLSDVPAGQDGPETGPETGRDGT
ncbi:Rieske (2Fe-2S) protein [Streptomyces sp. APSN-46.1]|uniref:Rieske (2Fe-2S) protein n=1 Tax=Streptomyces sp. APSN-46.1 TaxID=2929049 RepID=UPI001FB2D6DE|nr:Rieske (2Fe-2S) protein [Streptomyces sp. APSN-46.1]MCJ1681502.1 Rieske (2Fe-2S) protein [Streptomyces sp. APSN-46.1]